MPRRSNEKQKLIYVIKKHFAENGFEVTESKMLTTISTGRPREVDIVVEGMANGEPVVIAIEVKAEGRPLDSLAVEQIFGKYDNLPINKCVVVSWSGFWGPAQELIDSKPQRYLGVTPVFDRSGEPAARFFMDQFQARIRLITAIVSTPSGGFSRVKSSPGDQITLFDADGHAVGYLEQLAWHMAFVEGREDIAKIIHTIEDTDRVAGFEFISNRLDDRGLYMRWEETNQMHQLMGFSAEGDLKVWKSELVLYQLMLGDQTAVAGISTMYGADAVWVGSHDESGKLNMTMAALDPAAAAAALSVFDGGGGERG